MKSCNESDSGAESSACVPFDEEVGPEEREAIRGILTKKVTGDFVAVRPGPGGQKLFYLPGWRSNQLANQIFGFDGWCSTILSLNINFADHVGGKYTVCATATVRVTIRGGNFHEDVGMGIGIAPDQGAALEKAQKEAVSDARKRALRIFGDALGNCLYDQKHLKNLGQNVNFQNNQTLTERDLLDMTRPRKRLTPEPPQIGMLSSSSSSSSSSSGPAFSPVGSPGAIKYEPGSPPDKRQRGQSYGQLQAQKPLTFGGQPSSLASAAAPSEVHAARPPSLLLGSSPLGSSSPLTSPPSWSTSSPLQLPSSSPPSFNAPPTSTFTPSLGPASTPTSALPSLGPASTPTSALPSLGPASTPTSALPSLGPASTPASALALPSISQHNSPHGGGLPPSASPKPPPRLPPHSPPRAAVARVPLGAGHFAAASPTAPGLRPAPADAPFGAAAPPSFSTLHASTTGGSPPISPLDEAQAQASSARPLFSQLSSADDFPLGRAGEQDDDAFYAAIAVSIK